MTPPPRVPSLPERLVDGPAVIVGPGRVGLSLAAAMARASGQPPLLLARSASAARPGLAAAGTTGPIRDLGRWKPRAGPGLLILAVPDDALETAVRRLAKRCAHAGASGWIALHTSGFRSSGVFAPLRELGWPAGSWHPLQTFPEPGATLFAGIVVVQEGDPPALEAGARLARGLGAHPAALPAELKPLYHCLATIAATHAAVLLNFCRTALAAFPPETRALVWPGLQRLAGAAIQNLGGVGAAPAFTGPAVRGDFQTVRGHLQVLQEQFPDWAGIYRRLNESLNK